MKPRKNIVLDLDNTLICAEALDEFPFDKEGIKEKSCRFDLHEMDGYYIVFERPHVQKFLDYIFKNYDVSVWTAASKDYALFIIDKILLRNKPERRLKYVLFSYHCDISEREYDGIKDLRTMWEHFDLPNFKANNTIIIDDLKDVYEIQPGNCIRVEAFEVLKEGSEHDTELVRVLEEHLYHG